MFFSVDFALRFSIRDALGIYVRRLWWRVAWLEISSRGSVHEGRLSGERSSE